MSLNTDPISSLEYKIEVTLSQPPTRDSLSALFQEIVKNGSAGNLSKSICCHEVAKIKQQLVSFGFNSLCIETSEQIDKLPEYPINPSYLANYIKITSLLGKTKRPN